MLDEIGVHAAFAHRRVRDERPQKGEVGADTEHFRLGERFRERIERGRAIAAVRDDLREERIVVAGHRVALLISRIYSDAVGPPHVREPSCRRKETRSGIFRVDAGLDGIARACPLVARPLFSKGHP